MYYVVHLILMLFGFAVGAGAWASVCAANPHYGGQPHDATPFWWIGGLIGFAVFWGIAGKLIKKAPKRPTTTKPQIVITKDQNIVAGGKLVPCEDCGQPVSRRAESCPHCGCPVVLISSEE